MKNPSDPGLLQDSAFLYNSISQNMLKKYEMPILIIFYGKSVLQLISHKKSLQNVIHIRRKKFIGMERLIWMRTASPDKEYFKI